MHNQLWNVWLNNLKWISVSAKNKAWDLEPFEIQSSISLEELNQLEKKLNITYPDEFKVILINYARSIRISYDIEGEEPPEEYNGIFSGGGHGYLWDFSELESVFDSYQSWVNECFPDPENKYDQVWHNKAPFISVPNGDIIAFETGPENPGSVKYLSHEDGNLHGCRLGANFIDFISRWTNLGIIGTEDWQFEPFYDKENDILLEEGVIVENWKNWVNGK